ncbi:polysaccharide deacetylase family protein [Paenibacillus jiagnxiensis]|uniref:polysaccharide deacetylase family protein n=1 Tax=Paenibacillus jiagnxiensis TaxID=3228926 RepID=UPI0033A2FD84
MPPKVLRIVSGCIISFLLLPGFSLPVKHDRQYYETRGDVVWEVPMNEKMIALTFDDGPDPDITPQILDLLKQYDAKATFFVIGYRLTKYPDIIKREIAEGHEVANHTDHHVYFKTTMRPETIEHEMRSLKVKINGLTATNSPWFRPPGGYYNDSVIEIAKKLGYTVVMWSWHQDTRDWSKPGVGRIANKVLNNARNGDIVLLHDHAGGSMQTAQALKIILPELKKRGYRLVTVSELINHRKLEENLPLINLVP